MFRNLVLEPANRDWISTEKKIWYSLDELGFEPKTFRMQSEHSTPELHAPDSMYAIIRPDRDHMIIYQRTISGEKH